MFKRKAVNGHIGINEEGEDTGSNTKGQPLPSTIKDLNRCLHPCYPWRLLEGRQYCLIATPLAYRHAGLKAQCPVRQVAMGGTPPTPLPPPPQH